MKVKLAGILLLVAAGFVFSQSDWNWAYLMGGAALAFPAALLLTPLRHRRYLKAAKGEVT